MERADFRADWQPFTEYYTRQIVTNGGTLYRAALDQVSGATFDASLWVSLGSLGSSTIGGALAYALAPSGVITETFDVDRAQSGSLAITSGVLYLSRLSSIVPAGEPIQQITVLSGSTAAVTPTHLWFALYDAFTLAKLAVTIDYGTGSWPADTARTLNLATVYRPPVDMTVSVGVCQVAATMSTLATLGGTVTAGAQTLLTPRLAGASTTGLTDPASAPATAAGPAGSNPFYANIA